LRILKGHAVASDDSEAESPTECSRCFWLHVLRRSYQRSSADNVGVLAAAVAYYAFLSLFPALIAAISMWGLLLDREAAVTQAQMLTRDLPAEAASLITDQLQTLAQQDAGGLGLGFGVTLLLALWSASGAVATLVKAIGIAYGEDDDRGFVKSRALSLTLTVGGIAFVIVSLGLVAALPPVVRLLDVGPVAGAVLLVVRWLFLLLLVTVALAVLYRMGPDRADARLRWFSPGAMVASVLWLLGSALFSVYVSDFGSYGDTYGPLAGVAILLLWLYLTALVVLLGAEINAETERQTGQDTTTGPASPRGSGGAYVADEKPSEVS
jgi:membrane protein